MALDPTTLSGVSSTLVSQFNSQTPQPVNAFFVHDEVGVLTPKLLSKITKNSKGDYKDVEMLGRGPRPFEVCSTLKGSTKTLKKHLATTGMGPCVALIYAVEVVSKKSTSTSLGWIYSLCHMGMGTSEMNMKSNYRAMIAAVEDEVPSNGLVCNRQAVLLPGSSSKSELGDEYMPNIIIDRLDTIFPVNNVWEQYSDEYESILTNENHTRKQKNKRLIYIDSSAVTIGVQNGNLVANVYLARREKNNQAAQDSIDIGSSVVSGVDKESLMEEISEITRKERELSRKRHVLENKLREHGLSSRSEKMIWV